MNIINKFLLAASVSSLMASVCFGEEPVATGDNLSDVKCSSSKVELVMIMDKSGSMHGLESDTIGGFNSMIDKQKSNKITGNVTTVLFNDKYKVLYEQQPIETVKPLTSNEYFTDGSTALLDAVGNAILKTEQYKSVKDEKSKVIFVIITDGQENSSKEFSRDKVKSMISLKQEQDHWEFIFLGANIDAVSAAGSIGISEDRAVKYKNTASGVRANYDAVAAFTQEVMAESEGAAPANQNSWKDLVEEDK